jgi:hypothetical protein
MVVGAHALAVHGLPRATGDLDIWIRADPENAARVWQALLRFGAPIDALDITADDLAKPGMVVQLGLPPRRIDLLTRLSGLEFDDTFSRHVRQSVATLDVPFIGRDALLHNKKATGRLKDLADAETLEQGE